MLQSPAALLPTAGVFAAQPAISKQPSGGSAGGDWRAVLQAANGGAVSVWRVTTRRSRNHGGAPVVGSEDLVSVLPAGTVIGEGEREVLVRSAMGELFGKEHGLFSCGAKDTCRSLDPVVRSG
jgi:hypothetical protein